MFTFTKNAPSVPLAKINYNKMYVLCLRILKSESFCKRTILYWLMISEKNSKEKILFNPKLKLLF